MRNHYTTSPAGIAALKSQQAREGKVAVTGDMIEPTWHHTIGSLMQVGVSSFSNSIIEIPPGMIYIYILVIAVLAMPGAR